MFFSSGTEANDLAVHLARIHTGAFDIVSLRNGYHGAGGTPWGLTATSVYRHVTPMGFGVHHVSFHRRKQSYFF
jgi:alanine-glyoxylate transaminase/(R)-3-amino-2-methylpropionate-pyruvate transaminase